jgi:hypothetical protein
LTLDFGPCATEALVRFGLNARDTVMGDLCIGLCLLGELLCLRELALQVPHTTLGLGLHPSDARVRLLLRPLDSGVGIGLQFGKDGFGFPPQPVGKPVGLSFRRLPRYVTVRSLP